MDTTKLLSELEDLDHSVRVRRMVEIGKLSRSDDISRAVITELAEGSLYERILSLETCYGSQDATIAKQALASTSKFLKRRALNLVGLIGTDEEFVNGLKEVPIYLQVQTLRRFRDARRERRRLEAIETFLEHLEQSHQDYNLFRKLVPFGSEKILQRNLPAMLGLFSLVDWSHLAKYHPDVSHEVFRGWLARTGEEDHQLMTTMNHVMSQWLSHDYSVDHAVSLFEEAQKKISISRFPIQNLAAKRPVKVFQIIMDSDEELQFDEYEDRVASKTLRKLPLDQFLTVFKRYPDVISGWNSPDSFDKLTFEQRRAVYKIVNIGWRSDGGILKRLSLEKLPADDRISEACRHMASSKCVTNPALKIKYIAMLPWDEALELQRPFLRSSDADTRSSALKHQIAAAKFDSSRLGDALQLALSHRNERDPVKRQIMTALAEIPSMSWQEPHLGDVETIVRTLLETSDTSSWTLEEAQKLVTNILSVHPDWASKQFASIMRERNPPVRSFTLPGTVPVHIIMSTISQEMSPVLQNLLRRKDIKSIKSVGSGFGSLVKHWSEFLDVCEMVLETPATEDHHLAMLNYLKKYRPKTWTRFFPSILPSNNMTSCGTTIVKYIHLQKQCFLRQLLDAEGDILSSRINALEHLSIKSQHGFFRWTEAQQQTFAKGLLEEMDDEDQETENWITHINQLSALSFVDTTHIIKLAADEERPIVQEAAIRGLAKLDGDQGVTLLIEALSDRRARIAIYALRNVLQTMPKDKVLSILASIPQSKVTVTKETIRLIGELETEDAYRYLLGKSEENLLKNTRIALLTALLHFTDRDETWKFFRQTAENSEPDVAKAVGKISEDRLPSKHRVNLLGVFLQLLSRPEPEVRIAILRRLMDKPLYDPENVLGPRLFELVHSLLDAEGKIASIAIYKTYVSCNIELIRSTYRKLISAKDRGVLARLHGEYWFVALGRKQKFLPVTHLILEVLKEDRTSVKRRVKLMFEALYWPEIKPYLFEIIPSLHADALAEAEDALEKNMSGWLREKDKESLKEAEVELAKSEDEVARRLALAMLIGNVNEEEGWTREQANRLERYRQDDSPLVAERAWEVSIDEEANELDAGT